ncbi:hypothetical protein [uncultured Sulfitobacter sp.]|uniref:hypothetical protein n=1 Tax=uncultured Sulfitobacter sp. TaxID=191468 RepID=UPI0025959DA2|nr:hypothetical protein [uncultured Sulfitobacter sp.]
MTEVKKTPDGIEIPPPGPDDVLYEKGDGFARITLNRPTVLNAMNKNVQRLLSAALDRAAVSVIRKAAPFPRPPAGARRQYSIKIKGQ